MENMDKGADSLAENTPNAQEFICPICLPKPKSSGFQWKKYFIYLGNGINLKWILSMEIWVVFSKMGLYSC